MFGWFTKKKDKEQYKKNAQDVLRKRRLESSKSDVVTNNSFDDYFIPKIMHSIIIDESPRSSESYSSRSESHSSNHSSYDSSYSSSNYSSDSSSSSSDSGGSSGGD